MRLRELARLPHATFVADPDAFAVAEHHLRRALEGLLDAGRHVIARSGWGRPNDYADVPTILGQHGVLSAEFVPQAVAMARYRNRLVHFYNEVGPEEMADLLTNHLGDLETFARALLDLIW